MYDETMYDRSLARTRLAVREDDSDWQDDEGEESDLAETECAPLVAVPLQWAPTPPKPQPVTGKERQADTAQAIEDLWAKTVAPQEFADRINDRLKAVYRESICIDHVVVAVRLAGLRWEGCVINNLDKWEDWAPVAFRASRKTAVGRVWYAFHIAPSSIGAGPVYEMDAQTMARWPWRCECACG